MRSALSASMRPMVRCFERVVVHRVRPTKISRRHSLGQLAVRTPSRGPSIERDAARTSARRRSRPSSAPGARSARRRGSSMPGLAQRRSWANTCLTIDRREAEAHLVGEQQLRPPPSARAPSPASAARRRDSVVAVLLLAPRERRKHLEHPRVVGRDVLAAARVCAPIIRFSRTVRSGKMPRPSGTWTMPRRTISSGRTWPIVAAVEADRARRSRGPGR